MARLPRFVHPGHPQHVILRGNNRARLFRTSSDYAFYLEKLQLACEKHDCAVHAYVLMTNHIHLLITPHTETGLSKAVQTVGRYYVQHYNHHYQRTGTLFEGRYKATLIDSEAYLLTCMRYIELNPVRASMVRHASDYPWFSYAVNALGQTNTFITPHDEYQRLGKNKAERLAAYRQLFKQRLSALNLAEIRDATNKSWVLGEEKFKVKVQAQIERPVAPAARGGDRKSEQFKQIEKINRV